MSEIELRLRGEATAAEMAGDPFCRLSPEFVRKVADEIEQLQAELSAARALVSRPRAELQEEVDECHRLLREAVLRDGLCDEQWFREARKAGGFDAGH